ncbi:MAG: DUF434 domain-containing protein [Bacteroidota bacterium]|nr:DUF434 domain-containing protein [Bacteroidota bacterium]
MSNSFPDHLLQAAEEYFWILSKGYPQAAALKLVGDKFMLPRDMRQILYRGVVPDEQALSRRGKIGTIKKGNLVLIDTYNVLFTVNNYLLGKPLFISNDGLLRDAGEMRGRIINKAQFSRSVSLMLEVLQMWPGATYIHYLDEPVSHSGRLSIELCKDMVQMGIEGDAHTVRSPDDLLKKEKSDAICTSDGAIIDQYKGKVIDLPRFLLQHYFETDFPLVIP